MVMDHVDLLVENLHLATSVGWGAATAALPLCWMLVRSLLAFPVAYS